MRAITLLHNIILVFLLWLFSHCITKWAFAQAIGSFSIRIRIFNTFPLLLLIDYDRLVIVANSCLMVFLCQV